MQIKIKNALLEGYHPEAITSGIINTLMEDYHDGVSQGLDLGSVAVPILHNVSGLRYGLENGHPVVGGIFGREAALGAESVDPKFGKVLPTVGDVYDAGSVGKYAIGGAVGGAVLGGLALGTNPDDSKNPNKAIRGNALKMAGGLVAGGAAAGTALPAATYGIGKVFGVNESTDPITEAEWNDAQRSKFLKRGIEATNKVNRKQLVAGMMPIVGTIAGGAIGNQIHGDEGTIGGVVYDEQAHNDDEYDGTGALAGLASGLAISGAAGNQPNSQKTLDRLEKITGVKPSVNDTQGAKLYAQGVKTLNMFQRAANFRKSQSQK